ncbi:hypothetical protein [Pseudolabrys taiwanensis]|uniref:hypothetical protein n=1 Tax=Pseudolabrys taiwanensis TaxID=331696 RepID=UPI001FE216AE|nr:hypothetical protein [Pseudolabrys taiwanensis]
MSLRDRASWALVIFLSVAILIAPAIWNGFPLLQWDTGGYLARTYESVLVPSRPVAYGLILRAGVPFDFWPVLILQSLLTVWIVALTLRTQGLGGRPWLLAGVIATLSALTTLPWLTSILLTDIFCVLSVLALHLLVTQSEQLSRGERLGLVALIAVSAATHSATFAVLAALLVAAAAVRLLPRVGFKARIAPGIAALALGAALVFATNFIIVKRLTWTPGGPSIAFGRMLQDGIVNKYLDEHCPDRHLTLCTYKDQLPRDADVWFWGNALFDKLGRFSGLDREMGEIAWRALLEYPGLQIETALSATARQLVAVHSGEGVLNTIWHTYAIIERYAPQLAPAMHAARQQRNGISFTALNELHYPVALLSMALLPLLIGMAWRGRLPDELGRLATTCTLALLANAFVCGVLSNPHDRYGARLVWLAAFVGVIAVARAVEELRREMPPATAQASLLN